MGMLKPVRVTVVTPSFNQGQFINETLDSVASQSYQYVQHIIVDGGSTDSTVAILKRRPNINWSSESDRGQTHAINKGFLQSDGQIVTWLNSDDTYLDRNVIEDVVSTFATRPDVDVVYGDYLIIDEQGNPLQEKQEIPFDRKVMLYGVNIIGQPSAFFRRSLLERVGMLNESYKYLMDLEFWLRAHSLGARFKHVRRTFATYRWHATSKTLELSDELRREWRRILCQETGWYRGSPSQSVVLRLLNVAYRMKRQVQKLRYRARLDWFPTSWRMRIYRHSLRCASTHG